MLLEDPRVLDRHQPAGEVDQPRAERATCRSRERGLVEHGGSAGSAMARPQTPPSGASAAGATGRPDGAGRRPDRRPRRRWATSARSVSKVSRRGGLVERDPADLVELVVVAAKVAAGRLHQEVVDGLVDPGAALDEPVLDRVEDVGDPDLETGLLGDLAERGLLAGLAGVRACPSAGSRSGRRDRGGGRRRRARELPRRSGRRCRRPKWRCAVLSRATAPWRRSSGGSSPGGGSGPAHRDRWAAAGRR